MVRDTAHAYAQDKLMPRVRDAFRHEQTDPAIFREMGALGLLGATHSARVRRRGPQLRVLRAHRARGRARRFGLSLDDERAELARDVPDLHVRQRSAAAQVPAEARHRRMDRLLRPHRAQPRLRSRVDGDSRAHAPPAASSCRAPRCGSAIRPIADVFVVWAKDDQGIIRGFILDKGMKGLSRAEDRGQVLAARVDHRRDRDGRGVRSGGEPASERAGPQGSVRLPQQRALRHRVGRAGRGGILLARGAPVHDGSQAVRPSARRQPAHPEEARRHADRDHARPAGLPAPRPHEGRGHGRRRRSRRS